MWLQLDGRIKEGKPEPRTHFELKKATVHQ